MDTSESLCGKTVLITGATSLVGRQVAISCAQCGAKIIAVNRDSERLTELLGVLNRTNPFAHQVENFDLAELDKIPDFIHKLIDRNGPIDCFVHSTGLAATHVFPDVKYQTIDRQFKINTLSAIEFIRCLTLHPRVPKEAVAVFVAPVSALDSFDGRTAYATCRGAATAAIRIMAHDLASLHIRINYLIPCPLQCEGYFSDRVDFSNFFTEEEDLAVRSRILAENTIRLLTDEYKDISGEIVIFDRDNHLSVMAYAPIKISSNKQV